MALRTRGEGFTKYAVAAVGTNAGVTATRTAGTLQKAVVTHVSGSGDAAALVTIEAPTGSVVWRKRFAAAFSFSENFAFGEIEGVVASTVSVKISASTSNSEANIAGVEVPV